MAFDGYMPKGLKRQWQMIGVHPLPQSDGSGQYGGDFGVYPTAAVHT